MKFFSIIFGVILCGRALGSEGIIDELVQEKFVYSGPTPKQDFINGGSLYLKMGVSPMYATFSLGLRIKDEPNDRADDFCLSAYVIPVPDAPVLPALKYSRIRYHPHSNWYSGVGFEAILLYPNIELFFGKETHNSKGLKWHQFGINLLPIAAGIHAAAVGGVYSEVIVVAGALAAVTYSWGF